ncbi:hypothetical protein BGX33_011046 [Mortierella sp. NVP41]|nr:hypothetical protein BGX33_011046 [Mortierella sp. NVP41]
MFSSFKEKLNTSLSTLQEKSHNTTLSTHASPGADPSPEAGSGAGTGAQSETHVLETTTGTETGTGTGTRTGIGNVIVSVKTMDLTSPASPHSPTPSVQQQQGSFGSIASRISSSASSSSLFFRRPLQATRSTADLVAVGSTTPSSSPLPSAVSHHHHLLESASGVPGTHRLAILVQKLTLDPQEEKADPAELDKIRDFYSQHQQPSGTELSTSVIEKLEILRRYEARFPDLAGAFKKIVQEKVAAEAVLKASTPLEDLGDVDALEAHLQNMASKNEMSMQEIKRLSDELREALKAKEEESTTQAALIETLRTQLLVSERNSKSDSLVDIDLDLETKVNTSLDLSTGSPPSAPATPPPMTDNLPSTTPPTPIASSTPPASKSKKSKDPEKKNQALRELMVRLEAVLKEKNQAQEEQEEAVEQVRQLQTRLDQEIQVNKDITTQLDHLRATVAEMEESRARSEGSSESIETGSTLTMEESIHAAQAEAKAALEVKTDLEAKLSATQKAHAVLQESVAQTERTLETAKNQIRELDHFSKQLRATKMELEDTQEELQEKQRLLDLERLWREEAEESRDAMKREYDAAVKSSQRVLDQAEEKLKALESRLAQAVSEATADANDKISQHRSAMSQLEDRIAESNRKRAELERAMSERPDRTSEILVLNAKITQLEQETQDHLQQIMTLTLENESLSMSLADMEVTIGTLRAELAAAIVVRSDQTKTLPPSADTTANDDRDPPTPTDQTLQDKIAQLEAELEVTNRVPSKNALKKLRQDLNAAKQARADADETIAVLQAEVKAVTAASEAAKESDTTISLEELSSLKQERAELSEKLARLERLHQGFERSSSERIRTLEQELALLLQQKAALEAQVQEQSDLLIREKEKEKELEQARVAEGIDRVTLELDAVRTAERFASSKVTELAKERDLVAEKVVKLERHLEKLRECKVGQEQNLTGRIQELTEEKEALETQVEILQTELVQVRDRSEEMRKEWTDVQDKVAEERDCAIARVSELEKDLHNRIKEASATLLAQQEQDKEQMVSLTLELKTKSKNLAIAQEQAQVQRTMQADKIAQLSSQIHALTTERDSLTQPKVELESQLQEMTDKADRLEEQVRIMEEDAARLLLAKTKAQEQESELQGRVHALGLRERDLKDALALAKETMHGRDEDLSQTQKQLKKIESELEKTLQKLSKTEQVKKSLEEEVTALKGTVSKNQQEAKAQVNHTASQLSATSQELQRLKATQVKTLQERDRIQNERDQLAQEKDVDQTELERKQAELETLKRMHDSAESQMREYQSQLAEARNQVDTLEELTSIAKRVAETKVTELEQLRVQSAEAEKEFVKCKNQLRAKDEEYRAQKEKFRAEVEETREVLGNEIAELTERLEKNSQDAMALRGMNARQGEELEATKSMLEEQERMVAALEEESLETKHRKRDLELELQHFKDLEEILAKDRAEHSTIVEDFKMREGHLRTVNKTLKEEVRKLQKLSPSSPLPSPTTPHSPYSSQGNNIPSTPIPATPRTRAAGGQPLGRAATMALPVTPRWSPSQNKAAAEDDVNVEYLKNVLLNFMEHKDRRQQLIPVVAQMLRLSSDETKRFAKVV